MGRKRVFVAAAAIMLLAAAPALAQMRGQAPAGPTVAETGSAFYGFEHLSVTSADGARVYRVRIATPRKPAPAKGYPVVYLLDGDAALARIDEALLARLDAGDPPVIVAIGYEGDRQFDVLARAFDYTPAAPDAKPVADPAGRPGGGADAFLDVVMQEIEPAAAARAPLDPHRRALWGHSYGGLCVLHAALTRPAAFDAFYAASPSLWWNYGSVLQEVEPFLAGARPADLDLTLLVGGEEIAGRSAGVRTHPMWTSVPSSATRDLAQRLAAAGVRTHYEELAGQGHGGMLGASLTRTLLTIAGADPAPQGADT